MTPLGKTNMAIYFTDKDYLENFMNYIGERDTGFTCCGFTKSENLKEFSKKNEIAVLLTDLSGFEGEAKHIRSEVTVLLTEETDMETSKDVYTVGILQPLDEIVRQILKAVSKTDIAVSRTITGTTGQIYTFFSPVGRSLKTTLAMALSQLLCDREETLYLNLEPDSGFPVLFGRDYDADLADIIFYLKDGVRERSTLMLKSAIHDVHGVSYIPPVIDPSDLYRISGEEMIQLLNALFGIGYKNIVLDLGALIPGFEKLLQLSSRIYMPVKNDVISAAKTAQLLSHFRSSEAVLIEDRIERVEPPFFEELPSISGNMRGSDIAKYAGRLLEGNHD